MNSAAVPAHTSFQHMRDIQGSTYLRDIARTAAPSTSPWTWPMLLRRPTLAAFKHVYTFTQRYPEELRPLWRCVRRELLVVMALAPLLRCDLRVQSWPKLIATDALASRISRHSYGGLPPGAPDP